MLLGKTVIYFLLVYVAAAARKNVRYFESHTMSNPKYIKNMTSNLNPKSINWVEFELITPMKNATMFTRLQRLRDKTNIFDITLNMCKSTNRSMMNSLNIVFRIIWGIIRKATNAIQCHYKVSCHGVVVFRYIDDLMFSGRALLLQELQRGL